jgi:DNA helicase-2/ATP-dependent DNA helicase PcrA
MALFSPSVEQEQAIQYEGDMVVVARPGSGKTSVVSRKIRHSVLALRGHQGIIAISYTNKASDELERRCRADAFDVKNSFFGTIDDFCLREIVFPFAKHLMPVTADLSTARLRELPDTLRSMLPSKPIQEAKFGETEEFLPFLRQALTEGFVPLEGVGMLASYVIERSDACSRYLAARYQAVYVDEYQDSGHFQHQLFLKLRSLGLRAVAVGDSDQSIFGFAKKDSGYLLSLAAEGSGFSRFAITTNFRSHPSINDFALRLLDPLHPIAPTDDMRVFIKTVVGDQRAVGAWLTTAIPVFMGHYGVPSANRVAVLCRHQHSARMIADGIGTACHVVEDRTFDVAPGGEAKLFSDLLRLRHDPLLTAEALIDQVVRLKLSPKQRRVLRRKVLDCRSCPNQDLAETILKASESLLGEWPSTAGELELRAICGDAAKLRSFSSPPSDAVQIMTLHKAKGLEFDLVFHADLYDHVIPARLYPPGTYGQVIYENETQCLNLHYVGITRAVQACVLMTSNLRVNGQGAVKAGAPSQFIGRHGTHALPVAW